MKRVEEKHARDKADFFARQAASSGVFARPRVEHREVFGDANRVELIEFAEAAACRGAPLLCGLPGNNVTSLLAAGYFAKQLGLPTVAALRIRGAPPEGAVHDNVPQERVRILGDSRVCVLYSEEAVKGTSFNVIQALLSFCRRRGVSHLHIIDGVPTTAERLQDDATAEQLRFVTTDAAFGARMKAAGHLPIVNAVMPGFAGQLLADAAVADGLDGMHVSCVLAMTDARLPSAHSAVRVVRALDECGALLGSLKVDVSDLEDAAVEMEHAIMEVVDDAKRRAAGFSKQQRGGDVPVGMYM